MVNLDVMLYIKIKIYLSNNDITNNVPFNKISLEMIKQVLSKKMLIVYIK